MENKLGRKIFHQISIHLPFYQCSVVKCCLGSLHNPINFESQIVLILTAAYDEKNWRAKAKYTSLFSSFSHKKEDYHSLWYNFFAVGKEWCSLEKILRSASMEYTTRTRRVKFNEVRTGLIFFWAVEDESIHGLRTERDQVVGKLLAPLSLCLSLLYLLKILWFRQCRYWPSLWVFLLIFSAFS